MIRWKIKDIRNSKAWKLWYKICNDHLTGMMAVSWKAQVCLASCCHGDCPVVLACHSCWSCDVPVYLEWCSTVRSGWWCQHQGIYEETPLWYCPTCKWNKCLVQNSAKTQYIPFVFFCNQGTCKDSVPFLSHIRLLPSSHLSPCLILSMITSRHSLFRTFNPLPSYLPFTLSLSPLSPVVIYISCIVASTPFPQWIYLRLTRLLISRVPKLPLCHLTVTEAPFVTARWDRFDPVFLRIEPLYHSSGQSFNATPVLGSISNHCAIACSQVPLLRGRSGMLISINGRLVASLKVLSISAGVRWLSAGSASRLSIGSVGATRCELGMWIHWSLTRVVGILGAAKELTESPGPGTIAGWGTTWNELLVAFWSIEKTVVLNIRNSFVVTGCTRRWSPMKLLSASVGVGQRASL